TQREAQQANELSNLTRQRQLLASVNYRRAIIEDDGAPQAYSEGCFR
ncbi:hypothetical protein Tco_0427111, partial [Tanacetum coccineum]